MQVYIFTKLLLLLVQTKTDTVLYEQETTSGAEGNCTVQCLTPAHIVADNFYLSNDSIIESIEFDALVKREYDFVYLLTDWYIYDNSMLEVASGSGWTTEAVNFGYLSDIYDLYSFSVDMTDLSLTEGNYWLGLHTDAFISSALTRQYMVYLQGSNDESDAQVSSNAGNTWSDWNYQTDFTISGRVQQST